MKSLNLLKALIDLFLVFSVLGGLTFIIVVPLKLIYPDLNIPVNMDGIGEVGSDWFSQLILIIGAISTLFFIYAIFILRKVLELFINNQIFNDVVIRSFATIGKCLIITAILHSVPAFLFDIFRNGLLEIKLSAGFNSLLILCLGLLFIVIAEIFRTAKNLKEENELTV